MANITSQHILNTSANLLGFCLIVITSLHITNRTEVHLIDELTCIVGILLTFSCILSFGSIRTSLPKKEKALEKTAEYLFVVALIGLLATILLIAFNFLK